MSTTLLFTMLLCFAFSISIAVSIGGSAMLGLAIFDSSRLIIAPKEMFTAIDKFPLAAIPFFILAGNLMEAGGISRRLVEFAKSLVGGVQGGLPMTTVLTCMIFAAVSGSSVATTFAIGAILIPALIRHGYPTSYAAALQATSAELGVIIPPSIPMILFGVAAEVSIGDLFLAGIGPGILISVVLMAFVHVYCRIKGWGKNDGDGRLPVLRATMDAGWALLMPVIILGGIYGGVFTPTEASVVAVFYALLVGMVIHRELGLRDLLPILKKSVLSSAVIMFIIANAGLFALIVTREGVPEAIGSWLAQTLESPAWFLFGINAALFVIGMFIETSAAIIVLAPILVPVAVHFGIDPIHFGIIMVVNLALGMITPPFGVNLFAACTVAKIPLERIVGHLGPFVLVVLCCLAVITYVPPLSLGIRDAMRSAPAEVSPAVAPSAAPSQAEPSSPAAPSGAAPGIGPAATDASPPIGPAATDASPPIGPAATDASPPIGPAATDSSPPIGPAPTNAAPPIGPAATDPSPPIGPAATDPSPPSGASPAGARK